MKKIGLFLGGKPYGGGTYKYTQSILEALSALPAQEYAVTVLATAPEWQGPAHTYKSFTWVFIKPGFLGRALAKFWRDAGLPIAWWRAVSPNFHPVIKALRRLQCDLWVFPTQEELTYQAPVPALGTVHDLMHRYEPSFPEVSENGLYQKRERHYKELTRWAKGIMTDSQIGKDHVHESYQTPLGKIFVLPYVTPRYIVDSVTPGDFDRRYQLPAKFLFYPAQFWKHKNHPRLITALAQVKKKFPDVSLVLAGPQDNGYEDARRQVEAEGLVDNVHFVGYIADADMAEFYRRSRALIMPTFFGPTNIPQLEAFAAGCPVLTSRIYGIPAQVGNAALLFDPKSTEEMALCMEKIWTDDELCRTLIQRGKERATAWGQSQFNQSFHQIVNSLA